MKRLLNKYPFLQSALVKNSAWGIFSNIIQTLFIVLFFAICARKYSPDDFSRFLISSTVYQLVAAFSSMGLGQWFIREYAVNNDRLTLTAKFLKTQVGLGLIFYFLNIALAYVIYPDAEIRVLCILLGTNIIFDNFITAIKSLNIAEYQQKKTAAILIIDAFLKLTVGCLLFFNHFSTVVLAVLLIVIRLLTLSLFIKLGSANSISLPYLWRASVSIEDLKHLILKNWQFIVIGSIAIVYWRMANIIISKALTLAHVADFEIAFRVFSVAQMLPVIASATIFPRFIAHYNEKNFEGLKGLYKSVFKYYTYFAVASYAFIYSFSGFIVPLVVGSGYPGAVLCLQQMFLTFLLLPTVLLQANLIVAIGLEKQDMWFNIVSLIVSLLGCIIGLHFFKSLSVINYAILISFCVFHLSQDVLLIVNKLTTIKRCIAFYTGILLFVLVYNYAADYINNILLFALVGLALICIYFVQQASMPAKRFSGFNTNN